MKNFAKIILVFQIQLIILLPLSLASDLGILHPTSLKDRLPEVPASLANFGDFEYGTTQIGRVVYPVGLI